MSWNIAAGHGNLARTAETIRAKAPDIVGLQEVDVRWHERSAFADQADSLAKLLHMEVRFAPIYDIDGRRFGVALLSRYPIESFTNHQISRLSTQSANATPQKAPGFLEARVKGIRIFNTHLDYRANPAVRIAQVGETVEIMRRSSGPLILMGDLNAPPDAPELAPLRFLHDSGNSMTYPAATPTKRIDYILVSDHLSVIDSRVDATDASDHRPVIATVRICRGS